MDVVSHQYITIYIQKQMKILYILKHNPWGIGGGCYACRNYMDAFMDVFHGADFDFCICEEYLKDRDTDYPENVRFVGVKPRGRLSKLLSPITGLLHRHQKMASRLLRSGEYDYCVFDESGIAGSLVEAAKKYGVKTIVINHNYQVEYSRDNTKSWLKRQLILPVVEQCERVSYLNCDYNIFLTEEDMARFKVVYGASTTKDFVGGCFLRKGDEIKPDCLKPFNNDRLKIVISGTMGNVQNLDGLTYFLDELYPLMPDGMDVVLTGKNPPQSLIKRVEDYPNITIIPNPKDILSIIEQCDIFLCPTRLGGGMKLRVMDGFRCGLPVIAHKISARGYSGFEKEGYLWSFEDKEDFKSCINDIKMQISERRISKQDISDFASQNFAFEERTKTLKNIFF